METMQHQQVPAWLNLEAVVPVNIRTDIEDMIPVVVEAAGEVFRLLSAVIELGQRYDAAQSAAGVDGVDDLFLILDSITGFDKIRQAAGVIEGIASELCGGGISDSAYLEAAEALGLPAVPLSKSH